MQMLHVVPVGDGACSVWRRWPERGLGPATVIDCGVWRAGARTAADMLLTALDGDLSGVESFVVSHFDWDHWGGLRNLEHFPAALGTLDSATLYYPAMPARVVAALYSFMGPLNGSGSAALDLRNSFQPLLRSGESLTLQPLHSGHRWIWLAGAKFRVLWPPPVIDAAFSRRLDGAVKAVEDLADDLHDAGYPILKQNLDTASAGALALQREVVDEGGPEVDPALDPLLRAHDAADDAADDVEEDWREVEQGPNDFMEELDAETLDGPRRQHEDDGSAPDDPDFYAALEALPGGFAETYRRVLRRIRAANNDLSLVLASERGKLVAFGDISGPALRQVLTSPGLKGKHFDVMLLPHHGTHPLPSGMPAARWCVAQGGVHHVPRWQANHPQPHSEAGICWNTGCHGSLPPWI